MISASSQTCAWERDYEIYVAAGIYPGVPAAQKRVCSFKEEVYRPVSSAKVVYDQLYKVYIASFTLASDLETMRQ